MIGDYLTVNPKNVHAMFRSMEILIVSWSNAFVEAPIKEYLSEKKQQE